MPGPVLGELACELTREGRRIDARRLAARGRSTRQGSGRSTVPRPWVRGSRRRRCATPDRVTATLVWRGRLPRDARDCGRVVGGDISTDRTGHAIAAGKHVEGFAGVEPALVEQARGLRPSETRAAVTFWREVMGDERLPKAHDRQALSCRPPHDWWDVRGTWSVRVERSPTGPCVITWTTKRWSRTGRVVRRGSGGRMRLWGSSIGICGGSSVPRRRGRTSTSSARSRRCRVSRMSRAARRVARSCRRMCVGGLHRTPRSAGSSPTRTGLPLEHGSRAPDGDAHDPHHARDP